MCRLMVFMKKKCPQQLSSAKKAVDTIDGAVSKAAKSGEKALDSAEEKTEKEIQKSGVVDKSVKATEKAAQRVEREVKKQTKDSGKRNDSGSQPKLEDDGPTPAVAAEKKVDVLD